jgi:hypothetical protein
VKHHINIPTCHWQLGSYIHMHSVSFKVITPFRTDTGYRYQAMRLSTRFCPRSIFYTCSLWLHMFHIITHVPYVYTCSQCLHLFPISRYGACVMCAVIIFIYHSFIMEHRRVDIFHSVPCNYRKTTIIAS